MGRYDLNPKTKLPVKDEESQLDIQAYHGRLHDFLMVIMPFIRLIFRVKKPINIQNIPETGGIVIACNHTKWSNAFVVQSLLKRRIFFIGKSEILKWPIAGRLVKSLGEIPVDRSIRNSNALDYANKILKDGGTVNIYPEGVCNSGKELLPFKFGAVSMAQKAKTPIVPMAIWKGRTMFAKPMAVGKDLEKANQQLHATISQMRTELMKKPIKQSSGQLQIILKPFLLLLIRIIYRPQIMNRQNIPSKGRVIIASNHRHDFDPLLLMLGRPARRYHFIAKDDCLTWRIARLIGAFGVIFVNRKNIDKANFTAAVNRFLSMSRIIALFPEGTRNKIQAKLLLDFKMGAVSFANKSNSVLIPAAITGWYRPFRRGLKVIFDKPLKLTGNLKTDNKNLKKRIEKLLKQNDDAKTRKLVYNYYQEKLKEGKI